MPPKKKLWLPEDQPMLKSMGFGKSQPPSLGQTDSEPDTSNVSNDANQVKSPPIPTPPVPNRKFQENWISLYPWLVYDAENNLMKCSVCLNAKKTNKWPISFSHIRTQLTYWISALQDKRPEEFIWVRSFDRSIIKSSWNPESHQYWYPSRLAHVCVYIHVYTCMCIHA